MERRGKRETERERDGRDFSTREKECLQQEARRERIEGEDQHRNKTTRKVLRRKTKNEGRRERSSFLTVLHRRFRYPRDRDVSGLPLGSHRRRQPRWLEQRNSTEKKRDKKERTKEKEKLGSKQGGWKRKRLNKGSWLALLGAKKHKRKARRGGGFKPLELFKKKAKNWRKTVFLLALRRDCYSCY